MRKSTQACSCRGLAWCQHVVSRRLCVVQVGSSTKQAQQALFNPASFATFRANTVAIPLPAACANARTQGNGCSTRSVSCKTLNVDDAMQTKHGEGFAVHEEQTKQEKKGERGACCCLSLVTCELSVVSVACWGSMGVSNSIHDLQTDAVS